MQAPWTETQPILQDLMDPAVVTVAPNVALLEVVHTMHVEQTGCVLVADRDARPLGIFTERDLVGLVDSGADLGSLRICECMRCPVATGGEDELAAVAEHRLDRAQDHPLIVVDQRGCIAGLVAFQNLRQAVPADYLATLHETIERQSHLLAATRERLDARLLMDIILNSSVDMAVIAVDLDFSVLYGNPLVESLLDVPLAGLVGSDIRALYRGWEIDGARIARIQQRIAVGEVCRFPLTLRRADEDRHLDFMVAGLRGVAQVLQGYVVQAHDVTARVKAETALRERVAMEHAIGEVSRRFNTLDGIVADSALHWALERIGTLARADRSYLFQIAEDGQCLGNTHEWCAPDIFTGHDTTQALPLGDLRVLLDALERDGFVDIPDISVLPVEQDEFRQLFTSQGIRSSVCVALRWGGVLRGFVGLDAVHRLRPWREIDIDMLRTCGDLLANALEREQAQRTLDSKQRQLDRAMDMAQLGSWELDLATDTALWSDQTRRLLGVDAAAPATPATVLAAIHPDDRDKVARALRHAVTENGSYETECRTLCADGSIRYLYSRGVLIEDEHGYPVKLTGFVQDTTHNRLAEQELRDSEERFRQLAGAVDDVFWVVELEPYRMIYLSPAYERVWGHPVAAAYHDASTCFDAIHPDDRARVHASFELLVQRGGWEEIYRVVRPDGSVRWVRDRGGPVRGASGQVIRAAGVAADITEQKLAREALVASEEQLKEAQHLACLGSWALDVRTNVLQWSAEAYRIFGVDPTMFQGTYEAFLQRVHADDRDRVDRAYQSSRGRRDPYDIVHRLIRPNGEIRHVHERGRHFYDDAGNQLRSIGTVQDITERVQAEADRAELHRQLLQTQKMESLGQLTGGIAHDFNNILTSVVGYVDLAAEKFADEPSGRLRHYLAEASKASRRAEALVGQMLAFSRGMDGEMRPMRLQPLIAETVQMLRASLPATLEIELALGPDVPAVATDSVRFQQILMNLCLNARDAMAGAGRLTITLSLRRGVDTWSSDRTQRVMGDWVVLAVTDTGQGIAADVMARIFEPFFTTKGPGKGSGMGLSVVLGIVRDHHGHILVRSEPGAGACFEALFPPVPDHPELPDIVQAATPSTASPGAGAHILVVDDEEPVTNFLREVLQDLGYRVTTFNASTAALAALEAEPASFDLVLTDQTMPGTTGVALCRRISALRAQLPVLVMSGFNESVNPGSAAALGFAGYLQKPVRLEALRGYLDAIFGLPGRAV